MFVTNNRYRNLDQYTRHQSVFRRLLNDYIFAMKALFFIVAAIASVALLIVSFGVAITTLLSLYIGYKVLQPMARIVRGILKGGFNIIKPMIDGFYNVVRFALTPLKTFNNALERLMIHNIAAQRISSNNGRRILAAIYAAELIIGSVLMASVIITPVAAFLLPVSSFSYILLCTAMVTFNTLKLY